MKLIRVSMDEPTSPVQVKKPDPRMNHVFTPEERSIGGSQLSPLKILANNVRKRKYCSLECPFADACPVLPLAQSEWTDETKKHHPCKLRDAPPAIKRRIANMFLNGEDGLLAEIKSTLFITSTKLADDNKERMAFSDRLMRLHELLYGEKGTMINSSEPVEITVRQINTVDGQGQEVKLAKNVERKIRQQDNAFRLLSRKTPPPDDPESLINSPVLEDILDGS